MLKQASSISLIEEYELDIYIKIEDRKPIKAQLFLNQNSINLKIYNTDFNFDLEYEILLCEYDNYLVELLNINFLKHTTCYYSGTKDILYEVEKVLFKKSTSMENYKKLIIKSADLNRWIGFTKFQHRLANEIHNRLFNQHIEKFKSKNCDSFIFNIYYEIKTFPDIFNGNTTYSYLPYIEIYFQNNLSFDEIEKIRIELLDLFYLLFGFDLNLEKFILKTENENEAYLYYKKDYELVSNKSIFITLSNDLFDQYRPKLNLRLFSNFFKLSYYQKSFYSAFRKYRKFHYSEDKLLGYFRILENIMYEDTIEFTQKNLEIYLNNISLNSTEKEQERSCLGNVVNKPLKDRKEKIKFILFHHKILKILPQKFCLFVDFIDIEKIVDLRNDITHFNEYLITQDKLELYIDYLEFICIYALLKKIGYSDRNFIDNLNFYPSNHRVFDIEVKHA